MFNSKVFVAELIGTFALVFIGAGAVVTGLGGVVGAAFAHGLVLAVFVYAYGHISGTHVNPAVTFGLALNGTVKWGQAVYYWIAQFLGGVLGAYVLKIVAGGVAGMSGAATVGTLTRSAPFAALAVELVLTFFLVNTILHAAVAGRAGSFAGLAIGLTLTFAILTGGPMTGASLNPARTFGPALFTAVLDAGTLDIAQPSMYLIYLAGPLLGSALAVGVFRFLDTPDKAEAATKKPPKKK